MYTALGNVM